MPLLDLPSDILLEICQRLDSGSLQNCLVVSKRLRHFIKAYPQLEYAFRLERSGLINACSGEIPYSTRIQMLKQYLRSWRKPLVKVPGASFKLGGNCIAYELVAGVFGKTDGESLILQWLPSFVPERQIVRSPTDLGFLIKDFAMDPTQDLIAMIQTVRDIVPHGRQVTLHIRTLVSNMPHPEAKIKALEFIVPYHSHENPLSSATIQIADDILSLFFTDGSGSPQLVLWDWKAGTVILNTMSSYFVVPPHTGDFGFLSPRSFAFFSLLNHGSISIFKISPSRKRNMTITQIATLHLPEPSIGIHITAIHCHTGPFLKRPRPGVAFSTDSESRIHVVSVRYVNSPCNNATFFISQSAFTPFILTENMPEEISNVAWADWSRNRVFFLPMSITSSWLRYVQGNRAITALETNDNGSDLVILDFNVRNDEKKEQVIPRYTFFLDDVAPLPPYTSLVKYTGKCTSFMIDDLYILGLETSEVLETFEERIEKIEYLPIYP